tara:strand:- start:1751 stop:2194 length:444 start_codon:yes stop_codon:yes gene_type:complete
LYKDFLITLSDDEIDFLAIRPDKKNFECWQVEVTVSFRPIGYIGGGASAKRRSEEGVNIGVDEYIHKKFTSEKKVDKRNSILPNAKWNYVLVCAEARHKEELELFKQKGIKIFHYKDILNELENSDSQVNSTAGNIIEIMRYLKKIK